AYAKVGRLGLDGEDREDCVQQGFIRLWQKLRDDPNLLTDKGQLWVGIYIAYSGNAKQFHRHNLREHNSANSTWDGNDDDAYRAFGRASKEGATRAQWASEADEVIDTNSFLHSMKQHYANHPRK